MQNVLDTFESNWSAKKMNGEEKCVLLPVELLSTRPFLLVSSLSCNNKVNFIMLI